MHFRFRFIIWEYVSSLLNRSKSITVNNKRIENVKEFIYLGSLIANNHYDTKEIRRRFCIAKNSAISLTQIWKDKGISTGTKNRLLGSLVFSIAS